MTADREESEVKGYMNGDACGSGDSVALRRRPSRPQDARTVALRLTVGFRANKYPYSTVSMNADSSHKQIISHGRLFKPLAPSSSSLGRSLDTFN